MTKLVNRAKMTTATTGTGTISLASAVDGYQTFANAGVVNADVVRYVIEDGDAWEIGLGTYSAGTLTRGSIESSNADAALNLTGNAVVFVSAAAADLLQPQDIGVTVQGYTAALQGTTASYTTALNSKLSGIEAGATADQTASEILTAIKTVDGTASGLDADLLDGQHGTYYTGYTDTAIANLVATAPATLDTLNELAAALGDDPNFATTVTNSIGTKAASAVTISAGAGLTGGGDLTANRTISHADTSTQASLTALTGANVVSDIDIDTYGHVTAMATRAITAADLGALTGNQTITLSGDLTGSGTTAINAQIVANVVGANELNVTGNGTTAQYLRSDGDGSFTWATPTDTNSTSLPIEDSSGVAQFTATNATGLQFAGSGATSVAFDAANQRVTISSTDTNTTYSVGNGGLTEINFTSALNSKLSSIEAGATADQTATEILTAIKTVDGTGSGLDADLLDGNHASAFYLATNPNGYTTNVGDITGVTAGSGLTGGGTSGDVTVSHADTSAQASVNNTGRTYIQDVTLDTYGHVTGLVSATETVVNTTSLPIENSAGTVQFTATDATGLQFAASGASSVAFDAANQRVTISSTDTNTTYTVGNGGLTEINFTSALNTKLSGIEAGATADQTAAEILTAIKTVDGSGSGLDADLLDGQHGSYYQPASTAITTSNIGSQSVSYATTAGSVSYATTAGRAYPRRSDGGDLNFYWSGQSGQPPWLWGGSDGVNMYVYNPSNFSVAYAATSGSTTGNAATATTLQTARTIALSGAATGTATSFNGGSNISISVTSLNAANLTGALPAINGSALTGLSSGGMTLLGTLATTSGASVTLSGLNLTSYKQLSVVYNNVSGTSTGASYLQLNGINVGTAGFFNAAAFCRGNITIDLDAGIFWSVGSNSDNNNTSLSGASGLTTASTSITFTISPGNFDAGFIKIYGVK